MPNRYGKAPAGLVHCRLFHCPLGRHLKISWTLEATTFVYLENSNCYGIWQGLGSIAAEPPVKFQTKEKLKSQSRAFETSRDNTYYRMLKRCPSFTCGVCRSQKQLSKIKRTAFWEIYYKIIIAIFPFDVWIYQICHRTISEVSSYFHCREKS